LKKHLLFLAFVLVICCQFCDPAAAMGQQASCPGGGCSTGPGGAIATLKYIPISKVAGDGETEFEGKRATAPVISAMDEGGNTAVLTITNANGASAHIMWDADAITDTYLKINSDSTVSFFTWGE